MNKITAKQLQSKLENQNNLVLIDVRENYERELGFIPSLHIPMDEIQSKINEIPSNKEIVILCKSGRRAEPVAYLLQTEYHFPNVSILNGGLTAWKEEIDNTINLD